YLVIPLRALHALGEGEFQHLWMAAQLPDISLVSGEASAVDAALLARADADCLAALHIANGVRLRVFERYERQQQVVRRGIRELPVFCNDVGKAVAGDGQAVVALFKADAEDVPPLLVLGLIVRVYAHDVVAALALLTEDFQRAGRVVRSDYAVRDLRQQKPCGGLVAGVGEG